MDTLSIKETHKTPGIRCDGAKGVIEIKGRSIPENSVEFYKPLLAWVEEYAKQPFAETLVYIHLSYFNTSSSYCLLHLFRQLDKIYSAVGGVTVHWFYEQEDYELLFAGEDYESIFSYPFKMIEVSA